jgi:hypothetical protein
VYNYALLYIIAKTIISMGISFVAKIAKSGSDVNGNERRIIIIPTDRLMDVTKFNGKQVKVTVEDI